MKSRTINECQKCKAISGDDWSQCLGKCPVEGSPHYDRETHDEYGDLVDYEDWDD